MKKLFLILCLVSISLPSCAEIVAGNSLVSGFGGGMVPLQSSQIKVEGESLDWGDGGSFLGLSYFVFPNPYLGIGLSVSGGGFQDATQEQWAGPGTGIRNEYTTSMLNLDVMAAGRINFNPGSNLRVYLPFGAGLTRTRGEYKQTEYFLDMRSYEEKHRGYSSSLGWYAGLGVELDVEGLVCGVELRYQAFDFDKANFGVPGYSGIEHYSYLSFLLNIGYRF